MESIYEISRQLDELMSLAEELLTCAMAGEDCTGLVKDIYDNKLPAIYSRGKDARLFAVDYVVNNFDRVEMSLHDRDNLVLRLLGDNPIDDASNINATGSSIFGDGLLRLTACSGTKASGFLLGKRVIRVFIENVGLEKVTTALNVLWRRSEKEERIEIEDILVNKYGLFKKGFWGLRYNSKGGDKEGWCPKCEGFSLAPKSNSELRILKRTGDLRIYQCKKCGERIEQLVASWERNSQ